MILENTYVNITLEIKSVWTKFGRWMVGQQRVTL